jgi:hypothetical protein
MHKGGTKFHKAGYGLGLVNGFLLKIITAFKKRGRFKNTLCKLLFFATSKIKNTLY